MARRLSGLVFVALLGLVVLFGGKTTWADDVDTQIQAHLQAGEFGPAGDLAGRAVRLPKQTAGWKWLPGLRLMPVPVVPR